MSPDNLQYSLLWRLVQSVSTDSTGTVHQDTLPLTRLAFLGRSIEILHPRPPLIPTKLIRSVRAFVDQDMAHRGDIPLGGDNAIKLFAKMKVDLAARAAAKKKAHTGCC